MADQTAPINRSGPASTSDYVAVRSFTVGGQKVTRGLTRIAATHPWLATHRSAFSEVSSIRGKQAIRSLGDGKGYTRGGDGDLFWFTRP